MIFVIFLQCYLYVVALEALFMMDSYLDTKSA